MAWHPQIERIDGSAAATLTQEAEFLASENYTAKRVGITLDASTVTADGNGDKILPKGQVVARITATGRYGKYDDAQVDGRAVAKGFLFEAVNLKQGNAVVGMIIEGSVIAARCTGLDAAGEVDLTGPITFQ